MNLTPEMQTMYAAIRRLHEPVRDVLAEIDDEVVRGASGGVETGKAQCFEDHYSHPDDLCTELIAREAERTEARF